MILPNSNGEPEPDNLLEAWSPAARAASAASRSHRGSGRQKRKEALRSEYFKVSKTDPFTRGAAKSAARATKGKKIHPPLVTAKELLKVLRPRRRR